MEESKKNETLRKLKALADCGVGGEKENAQRILARLLQKYDINPDELDDDRDEEHRFKASGSFEKKLLIQTCFKVTNGDKHVYHYKSGPGSRSVVCCKCTKSQAAEIEFLFDFYRTLWNEELQNIFKAFLAKHRIFDDKPSESPPLSSEERLRVLMMMNALQDKSPVLRIENE